MIKTTQFRLLVCDEPECWRTFPSDFPVNGRLASRRELRYFAEQLGWVRTRAQVPLGDYCPLHNPALRGISSSAAKGK